MDGTKTTPPLRVAVGGFGGIGGLVVAALDRGMPGLTLMAVSAGNRRAAEDRIAALRRPVPVLALGELASVADVVVECAPVARFGDVAWPAVEAGRTLLAVSVAGLINHPGLVDRARETGARIVAVSGALAGLDAVRAAARGTIREVRLSSRYPPRFLVKYPLAREKGLDREAPHEPVQLFEGSARACARHFSNLMNVAAALSLAGIGLDRTRVEVWADPTIERNRHHLRVDSDSARLETELRVTRIHPESHSGRQPAMSLLAALRGLVSPLVVGA